MWTEISVPGNVEMDNNYSSFGQKLSEQSMHKQLKGWEVGSEVVLWRGRADPSGESLKLIRA